MNQILSGIYTTQKQNRPVSPDDFFQSSLNRISHGTSVRKAVERLQKSSFYTSFPENSFITLHASNPGTNKVFRHKFLLTEENLFDSLSDIEKTATERAVKYIVIVAFFTQKEKMLDVYKTVIHPQNINHPDNFHNSQAC